MIIMCLIIVPTINVLVRKLFFIPVLLSTRTTYSMMMSEKSRAVAGGLSDTRMSSSSCLNGQLFVYAPNRVAFESTVPTSTNSNSSSNSSGNKCILLGGLSDGLWPVPYTLELQSLLHTHHWSLVQPILSSSYQGFGNTNLHQDVQELNELIQYLISNRNMRKFSIIGHSTGCQDILHFIRYHIEQQEALKQQPMNSNPLFVADSQREQQLQEKEKEQQVDDNTDSGITSSSSVTYSSRVLDQLDFVVLQAPVSDREHAMSSSSMSSSYSEQGDDGIVEQQPYLNQAIQLQKQGLGQEMMCRSAFWAPITVQRYIDLHVKYGLDDYFSSDYTNTELHERLRYINEVLQFQKGQLKKTEIRQDDDPIKNRLFQCLVVFSGMDEYVPKPVDSKLLLSRLVQAMNGEFNPTTMTALTTTTTTTSSPIDKVVVNTNDKTVLLSSSSVGAETTNMETTCCAAIGLYLSQANHNLSQESNDIQQFLYAIEQMLER